MYIGCLNLASRCINKVKIVQWATYKPHAIIRQLALMDFSIEAGILVWHAIIMPSQGKNQVKQQAKVLTGGGVMNLAKRMAQRQAVVLQNKKGKKG